MTKWYDQPSSEADELAREVLAALDRLEAFVGHLHACPNQSTLIDQILKLRAECVKTFGNPKPTTHSPPTSTPP